ncbi:MAG: cytochrome c3 family protein [Bacteroidales bacterium]
MRLSLSVILLLVFTTSLNLALVQAQSNKLQTCLGCHPKVLAYEHKHTPAAENCEKCHRPNGRTHPVEGVKGFTLVALIPELCNNCHQAKNSKKNVHTPVANGKCLDCHDVHSSVNESLLKYPRTTLCQECHAVGKNVKKSQHKAVTDGKCESCHDVHQSDFNKLIKTESPVLCLPCHDKQKDQAGAKAIHQPFLKDCLLCHLGHNSDTLYLLKNKTPELCFSCHARIKATMQGAEHPHLAVTAQKNCLNCHSPHTSSAAGLLLSDETTTCMNCHKSPVFTDNKPRLNFGQLVLKSTYSHGAISKSGCSGCHMPHSSPNPFLLKGSYREGVFTSPNKESFLICFSCHISELLLQETTHTATGFRNGEQNLHYLHIQGSKTRSCSSCHNVHGAMNRKLIAEKVLFGNWEMPIQFKLLDGGGSCAPGCHSEKTYKR